MALVVSALRDMLIRAELAGFRVLLQLVGPVLTVVVVEKMVVMELHLLLFFRVLLPFVSRRRHVPFLLLFLLSN